VLTKALAGTLVAVVALSLMLTPLIMIVNDLLVQPRFVTSAPGEADAIDDNENPVIIAGFGRFERRLLIANGFSHRPGSSRSIDMLRRFGFRGCVPVVCGSQYSLSRSMTASAEHC